MIVAELLAKLEADATSFIRGFTKSIEVMDKTEKQVASTASTVDRQLDRIEKAAQSMGSTIDASADKGVKSLDKLDRTTKEFAQHSMAMFGRSEKATREMAETMEAGARKGGAAMDKLQRDVTTSGNATNRAIGSANAKHTEYAQKLVEWAKRSETALKDTTKALDNQEKSVDKLKRGAMQMVTAVGVYTLFSQAVTGVKSAFIDYNATLESAAIGFETMLGSAEAAKEKLSSLQDFAARTPFQFKELIGTTQQLLALGFASESIEDTLETVGDTVAALGGSMQEMGARVVRAFGQINAKGKVSAEEMMQLAEAGIPAWRYLAETIGVDIPTAMRMTQKTGIESAVAIEGILKGMNADFDGMMEAQSKTMMGAWSTVLDYLEMNVAAATKPLYEGVKNGILALADWMNSEQAASIGKKLTETLTSAANAVQKNVLPVLEKIAVTVIEDIIPALGKIGAEFKPVFVAAAGAVLLALNATEKLVDGLGALLGWIGDNEAAAKALAFVITTMVVAFKIDAAISFFSAILAGTSKSTSAIVQLVQKIIQMGTVSTTVFDVQLGRQVTKSVFSMSALGNVIVANSAKLGVMAIAAAGVTAAIFLIANAWMKSAERTAEAKAQVEDYVQAIVTAQGDLENLDLQKNIAEDIVSHEDYERMKTMFKNIGTTVASLVPIITNNSVAVEAWYKSLRYGAGPAYNALKDPSALVYLTAADRQLGKATNTMDSYIRSVYNAAGGQAKMNMTYEQFKGDEYTQMLISMAASGKVSQDQFQALIGVTNDLAPKFSTAAEKARLLMDASKDVTDASEAQIAAEEELEAAMVSTTSAYVKKKLTGKAAEDAAKAEAKAFGEVAKVINDAAGSFDKWTSAETEWVDSTRETLQGAVDPYTDYVDNVGITLERFRYNMYKSTQDVQHFADDMGTLLRNGLDPEVFRYLMEQGPGQVGDMVHELAQSPEKLAGFSDQIKKYLSMDAGVAALKEQADIGGQTLDEMNRNMAENILRTAVWAQDMQKLLAMGLNEEAFKAFMNLGAEESSVAVTELVRSPDKLAQVNALYDAKQAGAGSGAAYSLNESAKLIPRINRNELDLLWREAENAEAFWGSIAGLPQQTQDKVAAQIHLGVASMFKTLNAAADSGLVPTIPVNLDGDAVATQLAAVMATQPGIVMHSTIDPAGASDDLRKFLVQVATSPANVTLEGQTEEAMKSARGFLAWVEQQTGVSLIDADPALAEAVLTSVLGEISTSEAAVGVNADPYKYYQDMNALFKWNLEHPAKIPVEPTGGDSFFSKIQSWVNGSKITIPIDPAVERVAGYGLFSGFANGSEDHRAQIGNGRTSRVWNEPETGGEAYIPLTPAKRPRSLAILDSVAKRFGRTLSFADGGMMQAEDGSLVPASYYSGRGDASARRTPQEWERYFANAAKMRGSLEKLVDIMTPKSVTRDDAKQSIAAFLKMMKDQDKSVYAFMAAQAAKKGNEMAGMKGGGQRYNANGDLMRIDGSVSPAAVKRVGAMAASDDEARKFFEMMRGQSKETFEFMADAAAEAADEAYRMSVGGVGPVTRGSGSYTPAAGTIDDGSGEGSIIIEGDVYITPKDADAEEFIDNLGQLLLEAAGGK